MESLSEVTLEEFEAELAPAQLRPLQIVYVACAQWLLAIGAVLAILEVQGLLRPPDRSSGVGSLAIVLTLATLATFCVLHWLAHWLSARQLSPERLARAARGEWYPVLGPAARSPAGACLNLIRKTLFLRLVCYDAAATLGVAALVAAGILGALREHPVLWLNLLPAAALLGHIVFAFPTRGRLRALFLESIAAARRPI